MNKLKASCLDDALKYIPRILRKITVDLVLTLQIQAWPFFWVILIVRQPRKIPPKLIWLFTFWKLLFLSLFPTVFFLLMYLKWSSHFKCGWYSKTIDFFISLVPKLAFSLIISLWYALQSFSRKAVRNLKGSKLSGIKENCLIILLFFKSSLNSIQETAEK